LAGMAGYSAGEDGLVAGHGKFGPSRDVGWVGERTRLTLSPCLNKPYFVFRPSQALRRLQMALRNDTGPRVASLPCGLEIEVEPEEAIGSAIARTGVFELAVSEVICRLIEPGELAIDVGANIGHMTALMAVHAGPTGRILAFEPHPEVYARLRRNVDCWSRRDRTALVEAHELALSDRIGGAELLLDAAFEHNMGTATLSNGAPRGDATASIPVRVTRLDNVLGPELSVGVLKIDVEGHESDVLKGADQLFVSGRVRDVLFEEHRTLPTPSTEILVRHGYKIFGLHQRLLGVALVEPSSRSARAPWDAPTFLATRDPQRAHRRLGRKGWWALRPPSVGTSNSGARRRKRAKRPLAFRK
jgi:FkbM family methyltransferase